MRIHKLFLLPAIPLFLAACVRCDTDPASADGIVIMSYNLQTLFDPVDQGGEYDDYRVSTGDWDEARYEVKLAALASVILSAAVPGEGSVPGRKEGPDILVVQEAENERTLRDLALAAGGYPYILSSPDEDSSLGCGILSRYPPVSVQAHRVRPPDGYASSNPRHILEVELDVDGRRLLILAVHLKSKLGGDRETEPERAAVAAFVKTIVTERLANDPSLALLVTGDFNENPDEFQRVGKAYDTAMMPAASGGGPWLSISLNRDDCTSSGGPPILFCPWDESGGYSYSYQGERERIDNMLLCPALLHESGSDFTFTAFSAEPPGFAVDRSGTPQRWNSDGSTGYSDHLPIRALLSFSTRETGKP